MRHKFALYLKSKSNGESNKNSFSSTHNEIFDEEYQSLYRFDNVLINDQYSVNDIVKDEELENGKNITFTVFGSANSGKSTFLRGSQSYALNDTNISQLKTQGAMISIVNEYYTQLLDQMDSKNDIIVLKFIAFGCLLSNAKDNNGNIIQSLNKQVQDNKQKNNNKTKNKTNNSSTSNSNNNLFDDIYAYTSPLLLSSSSDKQSYFIVKKINSFPDLTEELKHVISAKEALYLGNQSYYILYHYTIEILSSNELKPHYQLYLTFYEINCEDYSLLQPLLIDLNTRVVITESNDQCQSIVNTITKRSHPNQTIVNILCLQNESIENLNTLNSLKMIRFLELTLNRNDLYDNTAEVCENCCSLKHKLKEVHLSQEEMYKEIQTMNEQADAIASIVHSIATYKKNSMKNPLMQSKGK